MNSFRILAVDDELLIRDLLYDFFSSQGWEIVVANSGRSAIELLKSREFDLVLTDLKMPETDGIALIGRMRDLYPSLPVIIMTGYPSLDSAVEALRYKVDDYITKPFNVNQLFKVAKRVVENSRLAAS
ncbi:MAG: response regulator [candidate division Zixibacteria bacterium]|nr:response regulator [candidate division Zixibacteria bacterium]